MANLNPNYFGPDNFLIDLGVKSVVNTDLLSGDVNGWYDTRGQLGLTVTIIGSAGITAGAIIFEQTNDPVNAAAGVVLPYVEASVVTPTPLVTASAIAANTVRQFMAAITSRYVRVRISTGFTGGTVRAIAALTDMPLENPTINSPVSVVGTATVSVSGSPLVTSQDNLFYNDSVVAQAAGATLTGTARDVGVAAAAAHRYSAFNASAFADQAGTLRIECSNDNVTWRRASADAAVAANTPVYLSVPVMTRYYRAVYVNGAVANTAFMLNTSFTAS